jgi:hypothetical protein
MGSVESRVAAYKRGVPFLPIKGGFGALFFFFVYMCVGFGIVVLAVVSQFGWVDLPFAPEFLMGGMGVFGIVGLGVCVLWMRWVSHRINLAVFDLMDEFFGRFGMAGAPYGSWGPQWRASDHWVSYDTPREVRAPWPLEGIGVVGRISWSVRGLRSPKWRSSAHRRKS